jgi:hypothetical protein
VNYYRNFWWFGKGWISTAWKNRHTLSGMAFCIAWTYNRQDDEHQCDTGVCKVPLNIIGRMIHTGATQDFENFLEIIM